ncbi:hypothetical protein K438DRAFT_1224250 [Mycena galopus ATCC 62051]|nr:hypothetical protein K438DRAFT_1224250 [Mycena galopus ATCC 62051]
MAPRAQDVQNLLVTASIHRGSYNPEPPTNPQSVLCLSRKERDHLEIYGDAILRERVVSFLFHEFPSRGAGFISTIQSALLSNHTFTNILLKAEGYSHPNGFPVDKSIADVFETMAALAYKRCPEQFEMWFSDTFVPLVNDAASLWDWQTVLIMPNTTSNPTVLNSRPGRQHPQTKFRYLSPRKAGWSPVLKPHPCRNRGDLGLDGRARYQRSVDGM